MLLFYDTETNGYQNQRLVWNHPDQPHLVQLGVILADDLGHEVASAELIVKPDDFSISNETAKVHGITFDIAKECGVPLATVMSVFVQLRANAAEIVAFNQAFDNFIIQASIHRTGRTPSHPGPEKKTCCMKLATEAMKIPPTAKMKKAGFDLYKAPDLQEAYTHFMGKPFENAHSALADARASMKVYFAIKAMENQP